MIDDSKTGAADGATAIARPPIEAASVNTDTTIIPDRVDVVAGTLAWSQDDIHEDPQPSWRFTLPRLAAVTAEFLSGQLWGINRRGWPTTSTSRRT